MTLELVDGFEKLVTWRYHPDKFFEDVRPDVDKCTNNQVVFFRDVANGEVKSIILCSARGTSKTLCLAATAVWFVVVLPYFTKIPCRVVVLSGSQIQSDILYDYCLEIINGNEYIRSQVIEKPLRSVTKFKMGWIKPLPASLKSTLGHRADLLIIDEAVEAGADIIKRAFSILAGSKYNKKILSSTPHDYLSLFVDIWEDPDKYQYAKHGYWSQLECPWITAEEIEERRRVLDEHTFNVDVLGIPTPMDTFFPLDDIRECRVDEKIKHNPDARTQLGIDWGWSPSPTVLTVVQVLGDRDHVQVLYQKPFKRESPKVMDQKIDGLVEQYDINRILVDNSHIHENERLRERGHRVQAIKFKGKKGQIMGELRRLVSSHELEYWEGEWGLTDQLRRYTEEKKKDQDRVDSLALACWKLQRSKGGFLIPRSGSYHSVREENETLDPTTS
jgi:hypothetical protein